MRLAVNMPIPPTANKLFRNSRYGRNRTEEYNSWRDAVAWGFNQTDRDRLVRECILPYSVPVSVHIIIQGGKGFPLSRDVANCEKAITDALNENRIIKDDSVQYVYENRQTYIPPKDKKQVASCTVVIAPMED